MAPPEPDDPADLGAEAADQHPAIPSKTCREARSDQRASEKRASRAVYMTVEAVRGTP